MIETFVDTKTSLRIILYHTVLKKTKCLYKTIKNIIKLLNHHNYYNKTEPNPLIKPTPKYSLSVKFSQFRSSRY